MPKPCPKCGGRGWYVEATDDGGFTHKVAVICPKCQPPAVAGGYLDDESKHWPKETNMDMTPDPVTKDEAIVQRCLDNARRDLIALAHGKAVLQDREDWLKCIACNLRVAAGKIEQGHLPDPFVLFRHDDLTGE